MATTTPIRSVSKTITPAGTNLVLLDDGISMGKATLDDTVSAVADGLITTAIDDLSLGTAAQSDATDFATAAQGATADTAVQPGDIGTAAAEDVGYFATAAQGATADTAVQPGDLGAVATSNDYGDLDNLPTLGTGAALDAPSNPDLSNDTDKLALRGVVKANVEVTQDFTGAVARPAILKLRDGPITLEDAGWVSGSALSAMNKLLNAGAYIRLKQGEYLIDGELDAVSDTPVILEGHWTKSVLKFAEATSGIVISQADFSYPTIIKSILAMTTQQEPGDALSVTYSAADSIGNRNVPRCLIEDFTAYGDDITSSGWSRGIVLTDVHNANVVRPLITGRKNQSASGSSRFTNMAAGIEIVGTDTPSMSADPSDIIIQSPRIFHAASGIKSSGEIEGLNVDTPILVAVGTGLDVSYTTKRPWVKIKGGHINCFEFGVSLSNAPQSSIEDILFYKATGGTEDTLAVHLDSSDASSIKNLRIINNSSDAATDGEADGILLTDSSDCYISEIQHLRPSRTVRIEGTSTGNHTSELHARGSYTNATTKLYDDTSSGLNTFHGGGQSVIAKSNLSNVTATVTGLDPTQADFGSVSKGERFLVNCQVRFIKGATAGSTTISFRKISGTATVAFNGNGSILRVKQSQGSGEDMVITVSGEITVTGGGTLVCGPLCQSAGSDATIATGDCQLTVSRL
jgi:hypothetical protein